MAAKYDWTALTVEFVSGDMSLTDFAMSKKIPYGTIVRQYRKLKWAEKRANSEQSIINKSLDLAVDENALKLAEQNARDLAAVYAVQNKAVEMLAVCDKPSELKALSGALRDIQAVARLALGVSTENANVSMVDDFEGWLNGRINKG